PHIKSSLSSDTQMNFTNSMAQPQTINNLCVQELVEDPLHSDSDCDCNVCIKDELQSEDEVQLIEPEHKKPKIEPDCDLDADSQPQQDILNHFEVDQNNQLLETENNVHRPRQTKGYKTLSLYCLAQNCGMEFQTSNLLKNHMAVEHKILLHRCLLPRCNRSFENEYVSNTLAIIRLNIFLYP